MNDAPSPTSLERAEKLQGMGCKRKRVEDVRFTQGRGNYIDDIKLPGMLHGDFHRSSHAHARYIGPSLRPGRKAPRRPSAGLGTSAGTDWPGGGQRALAGLPARTLTLTIGKARLG